MNLPLVLRRACVVLAAFLLVAGGVGMVLSFASMTLRDIQDVLAGVAGFVAGSVLVAAGSVSLTLLAVLPDRMDPRKPSDFDLS